MPARKVIFSKVEQKALTDSAFDPIYVPDEKIKSIVVDNFPMLGKLTALRFLEWVTENPEGVISLPTGKTPEYFIKWTEHILANWQQKEISTLRDEYGLTGVKKPEMKGLRFVQIDEFYPINPWQHNSFYHYVNQYYINAFGLSPERILLIDGSKIGLGPQDTLQSIWQNSEVDLTLRYRKARSKHEQRQKKVLQRIDQWCLEYEDKIRDWGGIGFFLGGIGPDGHIGFNVRGSDHHSTTRLTPTNYETQAAAATDLGGIEVSRKRLVITIGLGTITYNPDCTAIIVAAGEAKAQIVRQAIENEANILYPATALHRLDKAWFYLTRGAAGSLGVRRFEVLKNQPEIDDEQIARVVTDLAVGLNKRIVDLTKDDFANDRCGAEVLRRSEKSPELLCKTVAATLIKRIEKGASALSNTRFLHTEPHHDDIMLAYFPYLVRHFRDAGNHHHFCCLTSGFTSVSNPFMTRQLALLQQFIDRADFEAMLREGYFAPENEIGRNRDVWQYLDGVAANSRTMKNEGIARRLLRNLIDIFDEHETGQLKDRIMELQHYFKTQYPGKKDQPHIQKLKGMCREWEAECLWGYYGWNCTDVSHLRLGFYTGDIFTEEPTVDRDVLPVVALLEKTRPDVVTVAFDPEASGPDTHYKVLQTITEGLKRYESEANNDAIKVWGYRNVWFRFHPAEANIYVPVSLNMFATMHSAFINAFLSQKDASFPSYEYDGPFSGLAQEIQVDQYQQLKTCLGREWFYEHESPLIRATRGFVFLKEMDLAAFYRSSRELKAATEDS